MKREKELMMSEIQKVSLEVLKYVTDICEKENLKYVLAYGTLIGAVRHNGFIPWDDDIDIMMPRNDYDKLINYFLNNDTKYYEMKNDITSQDYPYMITRISDNRYELDVLNEKNYGIGIFIDIYPIDGLGNDYIKSKKIIKKTKILSSFIFQSTRKHFYIGTTKSVLKIICKLPFFVLSKVIGKKNFSKISYKYMKLNSYEDSKYVGCVLWPTYKLKEIFNKDDLFGKQIKMKFDKYSFNVPKEYDKILRQIYNDYMKLPAEKDRTPHHLYKAFKKGE